jgi:high-affinity Fe2+/Pb2+ permease
MGFGSYIGGLALCVIAVLLAILGFVVMLGLISSISTSFNIILGIIILIIALVLFLYGRYLYLSARPRGTINVHNE